MTPVSTAQSAYSTAFTAQAAADAAVATKKTRRIAYEPPLRALVRRIQAHPGITHASAGTRIPSALS